MNSLERRDWRRARRCVDRYNRIGFTLEHEYAMAEQIMMALKSEREQAQKAALDIAAKFCLDTFDVSPMLELRRAFGVAQPESKRRKPKGAM